ncbi:Malto-oligosyltrehalose trehalohydrolase [Anaerohalosphaera lusitana]|uniref:Malto-oligosyltrehalose trehalohydrolase n=1 Tax=Anaerohalosphaera lusitana TaxID=1936003 RepID=A0A1U9NLU2_9BACT|nr:malto-oligosyltrehalose trehalohydrolase [Anaerohalosphaera lusitana]AQT68456.1 Malto-oligosyltrehalose trehalohydrolase [Anaerohalosphaera lusitana]
MIPGADLRSDGSCLFTVWAPFAKQMQVRLLGDDERVLDMYRIEKGYWQIEANDVKAGTRYLYRIDGEEERPDPASNFQPDGVHEASAVVDHAAFHWSDQNWRNYDLADYIVYELHTGCFTPEGTFEAIIEKMRYLRDLGITAIELMPVAQFPGERNWGYDGVFPYAVQNSYGGPDKLKRLVDAAHDHGLAVVLDVVYNHLGPEGNYLRDFGPYFTDRHVTPWGDAVNLDQAYSDEVRDYFIENALYWLHFYHMDALRLDALHAIFDMSATHFVEELTKRVDRYAESADRRVHLIGESALNNARLLRPRSEGGYGLDAQWSDDFHHSVHALMTEEEFGYYQDYGRVEDLAKAFDEGYVYTGQYSKFRKRKFGNHSGDRPAEQFVVCTQNHDQVGNRVHGERLIDLTDFESAKLAAGVLMLSPFVPMLFMGQEYGEESPFQYFVSHSDEKLVEAVRKGRKEEFSTFKQAQGVPDPQAVETFERSKLNWEKPEQGEHKTMLSLYKKFAEIRRTIPAWVDRSTQNVTSMKDKQILIWHREGDACEGRYLCVMNFSKHEQKVRLFEDGERWRKIVCSGENAWGGPGSELGEICEGRGELTLPERCFAFFEMI